MKRKQRGKGEGSRPGTPHQRQDGRWEQWLTFQGKRYKRSGDTRQAVRDKITALVAELNSPERQREQQKARDLGPTLAELCEAALSKRDPDGSTFRTYRYGLARWRSLLGENTRRLEITGAAVQAAIDVLATELEVATVETYYAALRIALGSDHPALKGVELPEAEDDEDEPQAIIPSDLAARLQAAAQHDPLGICIGLGFGAGLRAGEAAALRWQDVDLTRGVLSINGSIKPSRSGWMRGKTKNRKTRLVNVSPDLRNWLALHQRIQADTAALAGYPVPEYVLADLDTGKRITRDAPVQVLRRLLAAVCTPEEYAIYGKLRYHGLRHVHVSALLAEGAGVADVAARVGHTPSVLLEAYAHAIPGADLRLAALAGELFPIPQPQATGQATQPRRKAPQGGARLSLDKGEVKRTDPHAPAESAEDPDQPPPKIRSKPHEPAAVSNPVSNPDEVER